MNGWCVVLVTHNEQNLRVASRLYKMLLPALFPASKWSIWCDAKSSISVDPRFVIDTFLTSHNAQVAFPSHAQRFSVYDEQQKVISAKLANKTNVQRQREEYIIEGLPPDSGLVDGQFILRDQSPQALLFSCVWHNEYLRYPPRDQTVFNYAVHILGYRPTMSQSEFQVVKTSPASVRTGLHYFYVDGFGSKIHVFPNCQYTKIVKKYRHMRRHGKLFTPCRAGGADRVRTLKGKSVPAITSEGCVQACLAGLKLVVGGNWLMLPDTLFLIILISGAASEEQEAQNPAFKPKSALPLELHFSAHRLLFAVPLGAQRSQREGLHSGAGGIPLQALNFKSPRPHFAMTQKAGLPGAQERGDLELPDAYACYNLPW
eukprot:scaffold75549_cov25-Tisochrysis_lutea.AAC.1